MFGIHTAFWIGMAVVLGLVIVYVAVAWLLPPKK